MKGENKLDFIDFQTTLNDKERSYVNDAHAKTMYKSWMALIRILNVRTFIFDSIALKL